jgi:hypothetical protein
VQRAQSGMALLRELPVQLVDQDPEAEQQP